MISLADATDLLAREALALDRRDWDGWLSLYTEDAVYWVPAWRDEASPTDNPDTELSLVYYKGRHNLADRVWRLQSGLSVASVPLLRTVHQVTNVLVECNDCVTAAFAVHCFNTRRQTQHMFFGRYDYRVESLEGQWIIAQKKITLLNDRIPTVADVYML